MMWKLTVPASSANLGAGFVALGIALTLYNRVWIEEADGCFIESKDGIAVPTGPDNMIYDTVRHLYEQCGRPFSGLHILQENNIPMTRGLGSSSACLVAGLLGGNHLLGEPFSKKELLDRAAQLEGHPDNVAPALLGGLVTAVMEDGEVHAVSVPVNPKFRFAVFVPSFELPTEKARAVLPTQVSRLDAVYNLSRAALMTASLFSGDVENLRIAAQDRLHQPYRFPFIPNGERVIRLAYDLGAYCVCISGAGPSLLAITEDERFAEKAKQQLADYGLNDWQIREYACDPWGAKAECI